MSSGNHTWFNRKKMSPQELNRPLSPDELKLVEAMAQKDFEEITRLEEEFEEKLRRSRLLSIGRERPEGAASPMWGETMLRLFLSKEKRDAVAGDLGEYFQLDMRERGKGSAHWLYAVGVAKAIGPIVWLWIQRLGFIKWLFGYVRYVFGL